MEAATLQAPIDAIPQHMQALAHGNHIRLTRAALKRRIAAGEVTVEEVLGDPPKEVATMTIYELLRAQHRWAGTRSRKFLFRLAVGERRQIGYLTARQRLLLIDELRERSAT